EQGVDHAAERVRERKRPARIIGEAFGGGRVVGLDVGPCAPALLSEEDFEIVLRHDALVLKLVVTAQLLRLSVRGCVSGLGVRELVQERLEFSTAKLGVGENLFATCVFVDVQTQIQITFGEGGAVDASQGTAFLAAVSAGGNRGKGSQDGNQKQTFSHGRSSFSWNARPPGMSGAEAG